MKITITFKLTPDLPTEQNTFSKLYVDYREMMEKVQANNGFAGNPSDIVELRWMVQKGAAKLVQSLEGDGI